MKEITLNINKKEYVVKVPVHRRLIDTLREDLGFTEVKEGCGEGECGSCTILLDDQPVNSCLLLTVMAEGKKIVTAKGLAEFGELNPLQKNFLKHGAVQCGYCTPGIVTSAHALLDKNPNPSEGDVRDAITGHICRCTGYQQIVEAVKATAEEN